MFSYSMAYHHCLVGNIYYADWGVQGMAVIVKYVVVADGKADMIFSTKQEAEAHDKMLDIAEQLTAFLQAAEIPLADDTLEALTWFMAQHREPLATILKGSRLQTPAASAPAAMVSPDTREAGRSSERKSSKAMPSVPTPQPQAAA